MVKNELEKFDESVIRDRIYSIRGFQVMLDRDLAELYEVETKRINEAVKRNKERFPDTFCFQLDEIEKAEVVANCDHLNKLKFSYNLPYVFTEHGVVMLSSVLRSEKAIEVNIEIIKAFVSMRKFIQANAQVLERLDRVELKQIETDQKFDRVFSLLESKDELPRQGIFFDGQIFDAYKFVSDLFRSAKKSIVIIDNYIDDTVLVHLVKANKNVKVTILTRFVSTQLKLDIEKFSRQYFQIDVKEFKRSHDRFTIIDDKEVYHFGASLKDLGKKWFGFSKFDMAAASMLEKLKRQQRLDNSEFIL